MKAILKFKLPKEKFEHHHAVNAWRYAKCLKEIKNYFDAHVDGGGKNKSLTTGLKAVRSVDFRAWEYCY